MGLFKDYVGNVEKNVAHLSMYHGNVLPLWENVSDYIGNITDHQDLLGDKTILTAHLNKSVLRILKTGQIT